jgi:site-specific DNA-methyltransferase (adenine-specific)
VTESEWKNKLYFGDNLHILREYVPDESVDLIYLDPPFNSKAPHNVLFGEKNGTESQAQITAFEDTWHWGPEAEKTYHEIVTEGPKRLADLVQALRSFLGQNDMMAYLVMMAARLAELHRVIKPTGSIYLHCDPTASHYLKLLMDSVFDPRNFRNEIIWKRSSAHSRAKRWGPVHDVLLFYSASDSFSWNRTFTAYDDSYLHSKYRHRDENGRRYRLSDLTGPGTRTGESGSTWREINPTSIGRHWEPPPDRALPEWFEFPKGWSDLAVRKRLDILYEQNLIRFPSKSGGRPEFKRYLKDDSGNPIQDVITDIDPINSMAQERLGYPTQKPETLLERIINASSNEGDLILDPFCGCGTTINVAERLNRRWIGIDITHLAIALMRHRLNDTFGTELSEYEVIGDPKDLASAKALAEHDRYQFEWWALSLVDGRPAQDKKKGSDSGIDGYINFFDDGSGKAKKIIIQVKSGHITTSQIRDLKAVVARENAVIGAFITLQEPTKPMLKEALEAGYYAPEHLAKKHTAPKIQILTIEDLLSGAELKYPRMLVSTFRRAQRQFKDQGPKQGSLL